MFAIIFQLFFFLVARCIGVEGVEGEKAKKYESQGKYGTHIMSHYLVHGW